MAHSPSYRRMLHKMGYYDYQQGLIYRHLNMDKEWLAHEERCRKFIIKALNYYNPQKVTVLGSGWLLELPLSEMAEKVEKIILADIVHPKEVISQTVALKNVELVEMGVSGGLIEEVWNKAGKRTFINRLSSLGDINIPEFQPADDPGMVISLNILTQLEVLPEKLLRKKTTSADSEFQDFKKKIQEKHLKFLQKHKSILISDVTQVFMYNNGTTNEVQTLLADIPEGKINEEWTWDFDLKHTDYNKKRSIFRVRAVLL